MSGLAFERARERVNEALDAGTLEVVNDLVNARLVDADQIVAVHTGVPAEAVAEWAGEFAVRGLVAVSEGTDAVMMIAGLITQALLTGYFMAEEARS